MRDIHIQQVLQHSHLLFLRTRNLLFLRLFVYSYFCFIRLIVQSCKTSKNENKRIFCNGNVLDDLHWRDCTRFEK